MELIHFSFVQVMNNKEIFVINLVIKEFIQYSQYTI